MAGVFSLGVGGAFAAHAEAAVPAEASLTELATLLGHGPSPSQDKVRSDKERREMEQRRKEDEKRHKKEMEQRRKEEERHKKEMEERRKEDERRHKQDMERRDDRDHRDDHRWQNSRGKEPGNDRPAPPPRFQHRSAEAANIG